MEYFKLLNFSD